MHSPDREALIFNEEKLGKRKLVPMEAMKARGRTKVHLHWFLPSAHDGNG